MTGLSQQTLNPQTTNSDGLVLMSDSAEAKRLQNFANSQGLGEEVYDEEFYATMNELHGSIDFQNMGSKE